MADNNLLTFLQVLPLPLTLSAGTSTNDTSRIGKGKGERNAKRPRLDNSFDDQLRYR